MPNYIGYAQSGTNAPTLFFDTGFLVQSALDPTHVGWHPYQCQYVYSANMPPDSLGSFCSALKSLKGFMAMHDALHQMVIKQAMKDHFRRNQGQLPSPPPNTNLALVDNNNTEVLTQDGRLYGFGGPLMRPDTALFKANIDSAHALTTLGELKPDGTPKRYPVVALPPGIYVLT